MSDNPPGILPAAACPRCGYDLEGIRATWRDSCPLGGVCSECGYGFEWADVLRTDRQRVSWFYEHARRWWRIDKTLWTWVATLWPVFFWRRLQPHRARNPAMSGLWIVMSTGAVLGVCLTLACVIWAVVWFGARYSPRWPTLPLTAVGGWMIAFGFEPSVWFTGRGMGRAYSFLTVGVQVALFNVAALTICLVGRSHWRARIHSTHLWRIALLGFSPALTLLAFAAALWSWRLVMFPVGLDSPRMLASGLYRTSPFSYGAYFPLAPPHWVESLVHARGNPADELFALAWLLLWWWCALRIGLHVRRPFVLWLPAVVAGVALAMLFGLRDDVLVDLLWDF